MAGAQCYKKHSVVYVIDIYGHLCCNYKVCYSKKYVSYIPYAYKLN